MVWDRGTWHPIGDPVAGYQKGHLKFELDGEKLKGGWALIRTHSSKYGGKSGKQAWLLIKESDEYAKEGDAARIVDDEPDSVVSGRGLEEIAHDKANEWHSNRSVAANVRGGALAGVASTKSRKPAKPSAGKTSRSVGTGRANGGNGATNLSPASAAGAKKARMPASLSPTLATLVDSAPTGDDWIHEVKFDGYRMVVPDRSRRRARLLAQRQVDGGAAVGRCLAAAVGVDQAWLDGEIAVADAGAHQLPELQNALSNPRQEHQLFRLRPPLPGRLRPPRRRIDRAQAIVAGTSGQVRCRSALQRRRARLGAEFFEQACKLKLEGAVSKRANSVYREGVRTRDWLKVKCGQRQEMVIGGFTDPQGSRSGFGALLLGIHEGGKLRYAGKVGTGFDDKTLTKLRPILGKLEQKEAPFVDPPRGFEAKGAHWVKPQLVAEIAFTEWSNDGALRHPSFQGLREDKKATDVVREQAAPIKASNGDAESAPRKRVTARATPARRTADAAPASTDTVAGVKLSHPDKPLFPEAKLVKRDMALYYDAIADWILPHLRDRPLALVRCPTAGASSAFSRSTPTRASTPRSRASKCRRARARPPISRRIRCRRWLHWCNGASSSCIRGARGRRSSIGLIA
jgi:bifunctional non-homologous end joining protein LigD